MSTPINLRPAGRQHGFTLVELLVVIAIIGMLVALLLPAVQRAREAGRRVTCLSNLKQIATGMINYETSKQQYPGYMQSFKRDETSPQQQYLRIVVDELNTSVFQSTTAIDESRISWVAKILPELDQNPLYDSMVDSRVTLGGDLETSTLIPQIGLLLCPSDIPLANLPGNAGMTYVANTGTWDWSNSETVFQRANYEAIAGDTKANGVFHNRLFGNVKMTMSAVSKGDGATNTIMLSENIHRQSVPDGTDIPLYTWAGVDSNSPGEQQLGMVWVEPDAAAQAGLSDDANLTQFDSRLPDFARPASSHDTGVFNTVFVDGNGKSISPDIDYDVYQRLMTVEGRKSVDPFDNTQSEYWDLPPLSSDDF